MPIENKFDARTNGHGTAAADREILAAYLEAHAILKGALCDIEDICRPDAIDDANRAFDRVMEICRKALLQAHAIELAALHQPESEDDEYVVCCPQCGTEWLLLGGNIDMCGSCGQKIH